MLCVRSCSIGTMSVKSKSGFHADLRVCSLFSLDELNTRSDARTERMGAFLWTYFTHSQVAAPQSSAADMGYGFGQG